MKAPIYFNWPGKVWIMSDPHFNDPGILKFERTKYKDINENNDIILKEINRKVKKGDTLVCLGDLGHNWEQQIDKINEGVYKVLLLGNHDKLNKNKYTKYFNEVYSGPLFINKFIILSHEPIPVSEHFINIHGHLHSATLNSKNHINVSYYMYNGLCDIDSIYTYKTPDMPRIRAKFLKEWYTDLYQFSSPRDDVFFYSNLKVIPSKWFNIAKELFLEKYPDGEALFGKGPKPLNIIEGDIPEVVAEKMEECYNNYYENKIYCQVSVTTSFSGRKVDINDGTIFETKFDPTDYTYKLDLEKIVVKDNGIDRLDEVDLKYISYSLKDENISGSFTAPINDDFYIRYKFIKCPSNEQLLLLRELKREFSKRGE